MKITTIALALITVSLTAMTNAQTTIINSGEQKNQLIELYTSEGCSSCPPADKWISRFKNDDRLWNELIPIAFHVDYWDRLGWKDELASNHYTQRQRIYQQQGNLSQVYTPGFVVDGKEWRGFFLRGALREQAQESVGVLQADLSGESLEIKFDSKKTNDDALKIHVAVLGFDINNEIAAGENRGKTLTHDFVVLGYQNEIVNHQDQSYRVATALPNLQVGAERKALVVWVSTVDEQAPIQAAGGWL